MKMLNLNLLKMVKLQIKNIILFLISIVIKKGMNISGVSLPKKM